GAGAGYRLGEDLGGALVDRIPIVIGASGPPAVAATRWVAQINENAKRVAIAAEIPEANHNALEAWAASTSEPGRFGVVSLTDQRGDARNERRVPLSAGLLAGAVSPA
ncbi:MAG: hypothetical protein GWO02_10165, partial [Gammaproteobacteria bacterium]|nr:hypothetical protein [Gammaproteobacteria bacterium]